MLKVVFDTNVLVSALINKKGPSHELFRVWEKRTYLLVTSSEILEELKRVLHYPRLSKKYHLKPTEIEAFIYLLEHEAFVSPVSIKVDVIKEDPEDNKILACALETDSNYIISGDFHLLKLEKFEEIPILSPRDFLKVLTT